MKEIIEILSNLPGSMIVGLLAGLVGFATIFVAIAGRMKIKTLEMDVSRPRQRLALTGLGLVPTLLGGLLIIYSVFPAEIGTILGTRFAPDSPLTVTHQYGFEPEEDNPWQPRGEKVSIARSSSFVHSGSRSLEVKLDVGPYEPGAHRGIEVSPAPFGIAKAIVAYLYLPTSAQTEDHEFIAFFGATGKDGRAQFSHDVILRPGAWVPLFWGTEYGYWDEFACTDADEDGSCDDTDETYWREWDGSLSALEIVVASIDRAYVGSVYVDDITVFGVKFPP